MSNIKSTTNEKKNIVVYNEASNDCVVSYYIEKIGDDKTFKKVIKNVESMVRRSGEYSRYISILLSNYPELSSCAFLSNIPEESTITLELHHHPFTLYDIVQTVIIKHIKEGVPFSTFNIASEVLQLHYKNYIGLVRLSATIHEMYHSGNLFIPIDMVFWKKNAFVEMYKPYFTRDLVLKYNDTLRRSMLTPDDDVQFL